MPYIPGKRAEGGYCCMEVQWIADRAALRCLSRQHPEWTKGGSWPAALVVRRTGSRSGACRLREAPPDDFLVLQSRSRARKTPPPPVLATSVIRSQKNLFLLVLSRCNQISAHEIAVLRYKTSIYFFRTYAGISHFFLSYRGIFRSFRRAFWILRAHFISEIRWNSH